MIRTQALMGTVVSIDVDAPDAVVARAFDWFREVEACCSRFDPGSELRQLEAGDPVVVSPMLFEAVRFALRVAEETDGAFDPTIGGRMAARGYNRHYATRETSGAMDSTGVSFRDVEVDANTRTIRLRRPLTLDLGAVAKGLAIDAAAKELQPFENFCIDAGGDLYFGGRNRQGDAWRAGIRHPRNRDELLDRFEVTDRAVCTSGDYERGAHILDARVGMPSTQAASATVVALSAMVADALATAAFVLGPERGVALLDRLDLPGLIVTPALERHRTRASWNA
ncbi:MAG: FAD:protein FMN transferase [Steroidobacteraceae bacterium]